MSTARTEFSALRLVRLFRRHAAVEEQDRTDVPHLLLELFGVLRMLQTLVVDRAEFAELPVVGVLTLEEHESRSDVILSL